MILCIMLCVAIKASNKCFLLAHITRRKSKFGKKEINQVDADCILEERNYVS